MENTKSKLALADAGIFRGVDPVANIGSTIPVFAGPWTSLPVKLRTPRLYIILGLYCYFL